MMRASVGPFASVATGISAAGASQGAATVLTANMNSVSTVSAGQGVSLPASQIVGVPVTVFNGGTNPLIVYPQTGAAINSLATNAGHILGIKTSAVYWPLSSTTWMANLSA